jgi:hypothetical protein
MAFQSLEQKMAMHNKVQWLLPLIVCQYAWDNAKENQDNPFLP